VLDRKLHKEDRSVQVQLSLAGTTSLVSLLQERYLYAFFANIRKQLMCKTTVREQIWHS
jgi:hypothetical protein